MKHSNALIHESSPYLLQHAHNPVNWYPWGEEALSRARNEDKLILVSIGYSSCHWCHVMEHESFEDEEVARVMNEHFVCIKVDREERPDIDHLYMNAVQLMSGRGGWPLNCVALPDGRPIWGGTYFPKERWISSLENVQEVYATQREKALEYAEKLTEGIRQLELIPLSSEDVFFEKETIAAMVQKWKGYFDTEKGGHARAPKFPMPNNWQFLMEYAFYTHDAEVTKQVEITLKSMAMGGIYDQIGGGFTRYSTDADWKVPHFEKMLYDNGQLMGLYSDAFRWKRKDLYREVVYQTFDFLEREMLSPEGYYYSALDADSEGVEGKYYTWTVKELEVIKLPEFSLFREYYNINSLGLWEEGRHIPLRNSTDEDFCKKHGIKALDLLKWKALWHNLLLEERKKRVPPGLDDKCLTSWNALAVSGLTKAYKAFRDEVFLKKAIHLGRFITEVQKNTEGELWRSYKNGKSTISAYLEDYALVIQACIDLYEVSMDEKWLVQAREFTLLVNDQYIDPRSEMFFFTSNKHKQLVARNMEVQDNVIPATNSVMANNLWRLAQHLDNAGFLNHARKMLRHASLDMVRFPSSYSNWGSLYLRHVYHQFEVAFSGPKSPELLLEFSRKYHPGTTIAGSVRESQLPLLLNRYSEEKSLIFVCEGYACKLPTADVSEAWKQIGL